MHVVHLAILVFQAHHIISKNPNGKKVKPMNFNSSYYREKFDSCKPYREISPVETAKARPFSARMFARCGSKLIVKYATKFNFPADGILGLSNVICWGGTVAFALIAGDGTSTVAPTTKSSEIKAVIRKLLRGKLMDKTRYVVRRRRPKIFAEAPAIAEFVLTMSECVFNTEIVPHTDFDYFKLAVAYYKFAIL